MGRRGGGMPLYIRKGISAIGDIEIVLFIEILLF